MKRLPLFISLFLSFLLSFPAFAAPVTSSALDNPVAASPDPAYELTSTNEFSTRLSLTNFSSDTPLAFDTPNLTITYSGLNQITSSDSFVLKNTGNITLIPADASSKLILTLDSSDPSAIPLDLADSHLYLLNGGYVEINAPHSLVGVRANDLFASYSSSDGFTFITYPIYKIIKITISPDSDTPFSFGLPNDYIEDDLWRFTQPGLTYSFQKTPSASIFFLLEDISGVNAKFDSTISEDEDFSAAETRLRASLSRDDTNPLLETDDFYAQTNNDHYDVSPSESTLVKNPDGSFSFRVAFRSNSDQFGFSHLAGFGPLRTALLNGQEFNDYSTHYSRSSDAFLETFDYPLTLLPAQKISDPEPSLEPEPEQPEEPEETEQTEQPKAEQTEQLDIIIPKAPNTSFKRRKILFFVFAV